MANMNIYLVTIEEWSWWCNNWHVVFAKNPTNAKKLCAKAHRDEWTDVWIERSLCKKIWESRVEKFESIIITDYMEW